MVFTQVKLVLVDSLFLSTFLKELFMILLPKPKTSLAGHSCPKYSISSTKELVSTTECPTNVFLVFVSES